MTFSAPLRPFAPYPSLPQFVFVAINWTKKLCLCSDRYSLKFSAPLRPFALEQNTLGNTGADHVTALVLWPFYFCGYGINRNFPFSLLSTITIDTSLGERNTESRFFLFVIQKAVEENSAEAIWNLKVLLEINLGEAHKEKKFINLYF